MKKLFLLMAIGCTLVLQARPPTSMELQGLFERQRAEFPQEKIYVMTDREQYMGGDTIWFRAFLVDAATHRPVKMSRYMYVELKAPSDSLISRVKIRENNGIYTGHISLPIDVIEADCTLSARTMYMEGMGEEYFFKKNIKIGSPFATKFTITANFNYDKENGNLKITRITSTKIQGNR